MSFLLLDQFTTTEGAPIVSPRTCEPGPGTLTITDTGNKLSITGGVLTPSGSATNVRDPWVRETTGRSRVAGRCMSLRIKRVSSFGSNSNDNLVGWANTLTTPDTGQVYGFMWGSAGPVDACVVGSTPVLTASAFLTDDTFYDVRTILRATGFFMVIGTTLHWVGNAGTDATLYPMVLQRGTGAKPFALDDFQVFDATAPWDTDYGIATNRTSSPSTGATSTSTADAIIELTWACATSETLDIMHRRTDDNNCWITRCSESGDTIKLIEKVAGVETERASTAQTFNNGTSYRIVIIQSGTDIRNFVANTTKNAYTSASSNQTETGVKISGFASASELICWPRTVAAPTDAAGHPTIRRWGGIPGMPNGTGRGSW